MPPPTVVDPPRASRYRLGMVAAYLREAIARSRPARGRAAAAPHPLVLDTSRRPRLTGVVTVSDTAVDAGEGRWERPGMRRFTDADQVRTGGDFLGIAGTGPAGPRLRG